MPRLKSALLASSLSVTVIPASAGVTGSWHREVDENKMDGRYVVKLAVDGDSPFQGRIYGTVKTPLLVVRCEAGKVDLILAARGQLGHPQDDLENHHFRVKFDDGKPEAVVGIKATSYDAVFFPSPKNFVRRLLKAKRLMAEVTLFQAAASTSTFPVSGLPARAEDLSKHCGIR